ncbi:hypothetical protein [Streptomyces sp. NBC_00358]|uniref:hypothetical protein n=1 Tax=Streptomyces sp. NBC_00358 TaxID=2975725 RepID=UPI002E257A55
MPGLIRTSVTVTATVTALAGAVLLLTGCQDSAGAGSATGTRASSPDASAPDASSPAGAPTPTPSHGSATASATAGRATDGVSPAAVPGCRNLTAGDAVKTAVTRAYRDKVTHFAHIRPVPHVFFYGQCGNVRYAATRFGLTAGATHAELVGMQDEGSAVKYFRSSGGGWVYIATDGFPAGPHGCADVPAIPHALAAAWGDCSIAH